MVYRTSGINILSKGPTSLTLAKNEGENETISYFQMAPFNIVNKAIATNVCTPSK